MGNCIGKMQGPVPPPLLGEVTDSQRPSTISSAPLSPPSRTRSQSAGTNLAAIPPRPGTTAAIVVPPMRSWNDLPLEVQENVATKLDLETARALRQTRKEFRDVGALGFTCAQIPTSLVEIGGMAEFFDKSKNVRELLIEDPANFTDEMLEELVSMLGDRGPQIERLDLSGCRLLTDAGLAHLAGLTALQALDLSHCDSLTVLPSLDHLTKLQYLVLSGCDSLTAVPNLDHLTELQYLVLPRCTSLTELPSLDRLTALQSLDLSHCTRLTELPSLVRLTELQSLKLWDCHRLTAIPRLDHLTKLQSLDWSDCESLTTLPNLNHLTELRSLNLSRCHRLTAIPNLDYLTKLQSLDLSYCRRLTALPNFYYLTALQSLNLGGCPGVSDFLLAQLEQRGVSVDR
jgi:hypothetical protein